MVAFVVEINEKWCSLHRWLQLLILFRARLHKKRMSTELTGWKDDVIGITNQNCCCYLDDQTREGWCRCTHVAGTFIAGLTICCGSQVRLRHNDKTNVIMLNTWVALLQLTTTPLFLVGWIWSIVWSAKFISISSELPKLLASPALDTAAFVKL